jgi:hypothetical protein
MIALGRLAAIGSSGQGHDSLLLQCVQRPSTSVRRCEGHSSAANEPDLRRPRRQPRVRPVRPQHQEDYGTITASANGPTRPRRREPPPRTIAHLVWRGRPLHCGISARLMSARGPFARIDEGPDYLAACPLYLQQLPASLSCLLINESCGERRLGLDRRSQVPALIRGQVAQ